MRSISSCFFALIVSLVILGGCNIFNSDKKVEKRLSLYFEAESLGNTLVSEVDSLIINEFKFSIERFIVAGPDIELESSSDVSTFLFTYDINASDERLILDAGLGISDDFTFDSYKLFLEPVKDNAGIIDNDFYGENANYSIIIKGTYNSKGFESALSSVFEKKLTYSPIELDDKNETLLITKTIDLKKVFINADDSILNPTDPENHDLIGKRINGFLQVEGFAIDVY